MDHFLCTDMTNTPRYRAGVIGHFVQSFSQDTKIATVRWHSLFKAEYRKLRDARAAKAKYEASGKILWTEDLRPRDEKPEMKMRRQESQQQELHI
jgi:hypothetical protein